jgi:hypothetical protein
LRETQSCSSSSSWSSCSFSITHKMKAPPKDKIPWRLQKLPHRHLRHFPCNNTNQHSPSTKTHFPL